MWRPAIFGVTVILFSIYGLGWLVSEDPERRRYGWIAMAAMVAGYLLRPWM